MAFQTEFEFKLPKGYVDQEGNLHKEGIMRLSTAADEILPMKDPKVQSNPAYLTIILLSRVVTKLGNVQSVSTRVIENLFTADFWENMMPIDIKAQLLIMSKMKKYGNILLKFCITVSMDIYNR